MATVISIAAAALLCLDLLVILTAWRGARGVYDEYIEPLDGELFRVKKYLGVGLWLMQRFPVMRRVPEGFKHAAMRYENNVRSKVGELYGAAYQDYYMQIHTATRWLMGLLGVGFLSLFALVLASGGDWQTGAVFLVCSPAAAAGLPLLQDKGLDGKVDKRRTQLRIEFPEFINKLVLLVNAGMTIPRAWEKIADETGGKTPLGQELQACMADIRAGKPLEVAYEEFGRRCRIKEIIKFVSVIILNLRKGGGELVLTLQAQSGECWEMRRAAARRLGEEASSKMMLPMAIMMLGIMMIVALPAILSIMSM